MAVETPEPATTCTTPVRPGTSPIASIATSQRPDARYGMITVLTGEGALVPHAFVAAMLRL